MRSMPSTATSENSRPGKDKSKILIKQSYVLLVWFFYLTSLSASSPNKKDKTAIPGFFVYPKKVTKFTILKAPMAHKTFSQEQISFSSYSFSLTFTVNLQAPVPCSKGAMLHLLEYFNGLRLFYGTNMLFLKNFRVLFLVQDTTFFSYYTFARWRTRNASLRLLKSR
jgi:hypothetical protein